MSERLGLLQAIRDRPDDHALRLVLADWLEDHGDSEQAEFIRVQIERARLPDEDDRQAELEARERRLLLKHAERWVPAELPLSWTRFRRGLPEVLAPQMSSWLTDEQIDSLGPVPLRELWLSGGGEEVDTGRIREMEWMERVEGLALGRGIGSADARDLLGSPWLGRLRSLDLNGAELADRDLRRILELPTVDGLEQLLLGSMPFGAESAGGLAAKRWPDLRELSVCALPRGVDSVASLLTFELWGRAAVRIRAVSQAVDRFAEVLCQTAAWGGLRDLALDLHVGPLRSDLLAGLLRHPGAAGLRQLQIGQPLTPEDLARLADATNLANLTSLSVSGAVEPLARSRHLTRLVHLQALDENESGIIDFVRSANADHLRSLHVLTFSDRIARAIADSLHLARLTTLRGGPLTDVAAEALANSPHLKCLTRIVADTGQLTARGQQALLEAEHLGWVGIPENQLKNAHLRKLWHRRYGDGERLAVLSDGWRESL